MGELRIADILGTYANTADSGGQMVLAIHHCSKPTIGALNGSAVGVGVTMTLPMSIRVASRDAKFGVVFARRGIVTDAVSSYFLPRLLGYSRAMHLVTTGGVYPATHDLWNGLFGEIVAPDQVLPRALAIAEEVVENTSMVSNKIIRDLIWRGPADVESVHLLESEMLINSLRSKDHEEGRVSFLEKRPPRFPGSMPKDAPPSWPWYATVDVDGPKEKKARSKL
jgi:enoyl-CoA hydratase/carnithine racemase